MKNKKGFSLIKLLLVESIILIIAAIAIPNLLRSRMAANEASAASSLRTIGTANVTYSSSYNVGFAGNLSNLGPTAVCGAAIGTLCADLLDSVLGAVTGAPVKTGYSFTYTPAVAAPTSAVPNGTYAVLATPIAVGSTGNSTFCADQGNVVYKDTAVPPTLTGPAAGCTPTTGGGINPL